MVSTPAAGIVRVLVWSDVVVVIDGDRGVGVVGDGDGDVAVVGQGGVGDGVVEAGGAGEVGGGGEGDLAAGQCHGAAGGPDIAVTVRVVPSGSVSLPAARWSRLAGCLRAVAGVVDGDRGVVVDVGDGDGDRGGVGVPGGVGDGVGEGVGAGEVRGAGV